MFCGREYLEEFACRRFATGPRQGKEEEDEEDKVQEEEAGKEEEDEEEEDDEEDRHCSSVCGVLQSSSTHQNALYQRGDDS